MNILNKIISALTDRKHPMPEEHQEHTWYLPEKSREQLGTIFREMQEPVNLHVFTQKGVSDLYNEFLLRFLDDVVHLSDKITLHRHALGDEAAQAHGVTYSPTLLVEPERYRLRFVGAPIGEEGRSFLEAVLLASRRSSGLTDESKARLAKLEEPRSAKVFVTPTCPYCPGQVVNAMRCAVERPDLIEAWCVETSQITELGLRYNVGSVPQTVFNEKLSVLGMEPEARFVEELITLQASEQAVTSHVHAPGETLRVDCLILGAGPAGLTAGIYAGRAGLSTLILERGMLGGQVSLTPVVENYPGYVNVAGLALIEIMAAQARQYCEIIQEEPQELTATPEGFSARTSTLKIEAKTLLLATGATWKKLGVPGEEEFFGHGVSYCATCDGYLYKGRKVLVVGGGNTALTDALYLKNLAVDVAIVHRRDTFRAEKHLVDSVTREGVPVHFGCTVERVLGDSKVTGARLRCAGSDATKDMEADGVFVAIGETPNTDVAVMLGCELTEGGDIKVDGQMRTSVPKVYAAGDVTGGVRQIVTAVGQGGTAALTIFDDLTRARG